jgi:hypothetical protein
MHSSVEDEGSEEMALSGTLFIVCMISSPPEDEHTFWACYLVQLSARSMHYGFQILRRRLPLHLVCRSVDPATFLTLMSLYQVYSLSILTVN